jgi:hypothetical protein
MPVYGEMLVRKERRRRLVRLDRRQELAGDVGGQQSVAVSAEYGRHLHRIVYAEPYNQRNSRLFCSSEPRIFAAMMPGEDEIISARSCQPLGFSAAC